MSSVVLTLASAGPINSGVQIEPFCIIDEHIGCQFIPLTAPTWVRPHLPNADKHSDSYSGEYSESLLVSVHNTEMDHQAAHRLLPAIDVQMPIGHVQCPQRDN